MHVSNERPFVLRSSFSFSNPRKTPVNARRKRRRCVSVCLCMLGTRSLAVKMLCDAHGYRIVPPLSRSLSFQGILTSSSVLSLGLLSSDMCFIQVHHHHSFLIKFVKDCPVPPWVYLPPVDCAGYAGWIDRGYRYFAG
ncbi:hypothetical protein DL98DRAFT_128049 [Cadophora sp. DSE1049]|nr:hypothetical protein DL98DRAFT_128049 [Cadophora sp. DSE1049]